LAILEEQIAIGAASESPQKFRRGRRLSRGGTPGSRDFL